MQNNLQDVMHSWLLMIILSHRYLHRCLYLKIIDNQEYITIPYSSFSPLSSSALSLLSSRHGVDAMSRSNLKFSLFISEKVASNCLQMHLFYGRWGVGAMSTSDLEKLHQTSDLKLSLFIISEKASSNC